MACRRATRLSGGVRPPHRSLPQTPAAHLLVHPGRRRWLASSSAPSAAWVIRPRRQRPLPSSVLMSAIPARVAGVEQIALVTPPRRGSPVVDTTIWRRLPGRRDEVYLLARAQAIAALAYGTHSVPPWTKSLARATCSLPG